MVQNGISTPVAGSTGLGAASGRLTCRASAATDRPDVIVSDPPGMFGVCARLRTD